MQPLSLQVLFFLLTASFLVWREYVSFQSIKLLNAKVSAHKRCLDSMKETINSQAKNLASVSQAYMALTTHAENTRQFAEKAEINLDRIAREFEMIMSYRKENLRHFDGIEGL